MGTQQEVIKKFVKSLDDSSLYGTEALDEAVVYASSGLYSSWSDLVTAFVNDVSLYGGEGSSTTRALDSKTNNFLKEYCGIDLTNTDTGAITGYDTGASTTQLSAESIVPETTTTSAVYPTESSTTYNGLTIVWPDYSTLTDTERNIVSALYSWWMQPALNLVENSIGISFNESDVSNHTMTITFDRNSSGSVLASANQYNLTIYSQAFASVDINGGENSGKRTRGSYADRILAHELTHAVMAANETSGLWSSTLICVDEGIAELVHGVDDTRKGEIVNIAQSVNAAQLQKALYYNRYTSEDYYDAYAGGYMLFRYFAKQVAEKLFTGTAIIDLSKATSSTGKFVVTSTSTGKVNATFTTGDASSTQTKIGTVQSSRVYTASFDSAQVITALASVFAWNITGSSDNDTITGGSGADSINGDDGDDLITGNAGNDTLTGGNGNDTFSYASGDGNDVITDYTVGEDIIKLKSGSIDSSYLNGSDVILKVGSGSIKVKGAAKKLITVANSNGSVTSAIYGIPNGVVYNSNSTAVSLTSDFAGTLNSSDYYNTVKTINATTRSNSVYIKGNSNANTIYGSSGADTIYGGTGNDSIIGGVGNDKLYGESGNDYLSGGLGADTIRGGKGDDTLSGGSGKDVFIYSSGDGKDVITDYTAGQDSIKLMSGSITGSSFSGNDLILKIGTGSITVKNGKNKVITLVDSSGKSSSKSYTEIKQLNVTNSNSATITVNSSYQNIDASSRTNAVRITGNSLANTIEGGSGNDTIFGGAENDSILGNAGTDSLSGGTGADTLIGGKGNDTLTGGTGADVFIYDTGDGNDIITDYTSGQDKIKITSGTLSSSSLSASDVVLKIGNGSIKVKNSVNKTITLVNSSNKTTALIHGSSGKDTIIGTSGADSLCGNAGADSLSGGAGADTLIGGKGNDTLTGGTGANVFVYAIGDGNDVITDYTTQDKIKITGSYSTLNSGNDVIINISADTGAGTGSITLNNAKGKTLNIISTSTAAYEERWFMEGDDNYVNTDVSTIVNSDNPIENGYNLSNELNLNQINDSLTFNPLTYRKSEKNG